MDSVLTRWSLSFRVLLNSPTGGGFPGGNTTQPSRPLQGEALFLSRPPRLWLRASSPPADPAKSLTSIHTQHVLQSFLPLLPSSAFPEVPAAPPYASSGRFSSPCRETAPRSISRKVTASRACPRGAPPAKTSERGVFKKPPQSVPSTRRVCCRGRRVRELPRPRQPHAA